MDESPRPSGTLTDAYASSGVVFILGTQDAVCSTVRQIPYAERYSGFTANIETPIQRLQEATRSEQERRAK